MDRILRTLILSLAEGRTRFIKLRSSLIEFCEDIDESDIDVNHVEHLTKKLCELSRYLSKQDRISQEPSVETTVQDLNREVPEGADEGDKTVAAEDSSQSDVAPESPAYLQGGKATFSVPLNRAYDSPPNTSEPPTEETETPDAESAETTNTALPEDKAAPPSENGGIIAPHSETGNTSSDTGLATDGAGIEELFSHVANGRLTAGDAARQIHVQGEDTIESVVHALGNYQHRSVATDIVITIGESAIPVLVRHLGDFRLSYDIKNVLEQLHPNRATTLFSELKDATDQEVINALLKVIGEIKPPEAVQNVKAYLHHQEYSVTYQAERTLRDLGLGYAEIDKLKKAL